VFAPICTPFAGDEAVDYEALRFNVSRCVGKGVVGEQLGQAIASAAAHRALPARAYACYLRGGRAERHAMRGCPPVARQCVHPPDPRIDS